MTTKKLSRVLGVVVVALMLAALLAVSSLAYSVDLYGKVTGLDAATEYTYAKYDFAADTWGEFTALDADTVLGQGVYGIKAGDAEPVAIFIAGKGNGEVNFWDDDAAAPAGNIYQRSTADFVPGKWTTLPGGADTVLGMYAGYPALTWYVGHDKVFDKALVQDTNEDGTPKVDEEGNPVMVSAKTHGEGSTAKIGETNLLQETVIRYTFADDQIVPAKNVTGWTLDPRGVTSIGTTTYRNPDYTDADVKGTFTWVVKTVDGETERYTIDTTGVKQTYFAVPAEMAASNGYLVAIEYAPYANCPDDIMKIIANNGTQSACYLYWYMYKGVNAIDYVASAFPAPTDDIMGGLGTFNLDPSRDWEVAVATINETGDGVAVGEWAAFDPDSRAYAGLYAIREVAGGRYTHYVLAYTYGSEAARNALGAFTTKNDMEAWVTSTENKFIPGTWSGDAITTHASVGSHKSITSLGGGHIDAAFTANWCKAADAAAKATAAAVIKNAADKVEFKYALDNTEIVNVGEFESFKFSVSERMGEKGTIALGEVTIKTTFKIMDLDGTVTDYVTTKTANHRTYTTVTVTPDSFADWPTEGYLVGIEINPWTNSDPANYTHTEGTHYNTLASLDPGAYSVAPTPELPVSGPAPEGLEFVAPATITGLDSTKTYQYALWDINGIALDAWTTVQGAESIDVSNLTGLIAVRFPGDGIITQGSESAVLLRPGTNISNILSFHTSTCNDGCNKGERITLDTVSVDAIKVMDPFTFNTGAWTAVSFNDRLNNHYGYESYMMGGTSGYLADQAGIYLADPSDENSELLRQGINSVDLTFAQAGDQITTADKFISFTYRGVVRQSPFVYEGQMQSQMMLAVADKNGNVTYKTARKNITNNQTKANIGYDITFRAEDFGTLSSDEYLVGMVLTPFYADESVKVTATSAGSTDIIFNIMPDAYAVDASLPSSKQPLGVYLDGNTIQGIPAGITAEWAVWTMGAINVEWAAAENGTVIPDGITGIIAVRNAGDGIFTGGSEAVLGYIPSPASAREDLAVVTGGKPAYDTTHENTGFVPGNWSGSYLTWYDQTTGAYSFLDQKTGVTVEQVRDLYFYQHTRADVEATLKAYCDSHKDLPIPSYWAAGSVRSDSYMTAEIDKHYNAADYEATKDQKMATLIADMEAGMESRFIRYTFDATDITPVDELLQMSFTNKVRQGGFKFSAKAGIVVHVVDSLGNHTTHRLLDDTTFVATAGSWYKQTFNIQDAENLPTEGWIVAIDYYAYMDVDPTTYVASPSEMDSSNVAFRWTQQHVCMGYYYDEVLVARPVLETPDVTFENGVVTGLDAAVKYEFGYMTPDGLELVDEVTGATSYTVPTTGLWAVRAVPTNDDYNPSAVAVFYNKDMTAARDTIFDHMMDFKYKDGSIVQITDRVAAASAFAAGVAPEFNAGKWTGFSNSGSIRNYYSNSGYLATTATPISKTYAIAIRDAANANLLAAAQAASKAVLETIYYSYEYMPDEVIPMEEFVSMSFAVGRRQGGHNTDGAGVRAKVVFKVVLEDGTIEDRVYLAPARNLQVGQTVTVSLSDFEDTTGYIVGIVVYPNGVVDASTLICIGEDNEDYTVDVTNATYNVFPADPASIEVPTLGYTARKSVVTVTNYNPVFRYAYSYDNGETWTEFMGDSFNAVKASTQYIVKAVGPSSVGDSAPSEPITTTYATVVGASIVLDGNIGLKIYMDIDMDNIDSIAYVMTKVNSDYTSADGNLYRHNSSFNHWAGIDNWATKMTLDETTGLWTATLYVPAKDIDNTNFETDFGIYTKADPNTRISVDNRGYRFDTLIAEAKALAAAGDAEFAAAADLLDNLDNYVSYADNYFNQGTDAAYVTDASMDEIADPTKDGALEGITFSATSLILEDEVTIRHYFTVEDLAAFEAAGYTVNGTKGEKGELIYFDIKDIAAQNIGTTYTLTFTDGNGAVAYEINYSVANYIKQMTTSDNANLVSLVNAMYDYYLAAAAYKA